MVKSNAYFKIIYKDDMTYLKIFPAIGEGKNISYSEVSMYLEKHKISGIDNVMLNKMIITGKECEIKISDKKIIPESEDCLILISPDKMIARIRYYPPSDDGMIFSKKDILEELKRNGVVYGIDEEVIERFLNNRKYCKTYTVARGLAPIDGHSAHITYNFKTDKSLKPKLNEDGSVDFHSLDNINNVNQGDVLATMIPVDYGTPGMDVSGKTLAPVKVENKVFKYGKNIHASDDGLSLISDIMGHVELQDERVFVSGTYEIYNNVDASTGDIDYSGNVHISGSVTSGFTVKAKGDVSIDGVVEGATVIAGGNVIVTGGIQGQKKGIIDAKGDVVARFIENGIVKAGGCVRTESILYSDVSSKKDIFVTGKKGNIVGGITRAINSIQCRMLGSQMETRTEIEVGIDPAVVEELETLKNEIATHQSNLEKTGKIVEVFKKKLAAGEKISPDKITMFKNVRDSYNNSITVLTEKSQRYSVLKNEILGMQDGRVRVEGMSCLGVKITISNTVYYVRKELSHIQYIKECGEIKELSI